MRRSTLLCLVPLFVAVSLSAQAFEGTVLVRLPIGNDSMTPVKYLIKGDKMATVITGTASMGPMIAGREIRMIVDNTAMTMTMLIPMEMGGMKGMKMVTDLSKAATEANAKNVQAKALGTSEIIAGYKCDNFSITDGKDVTVVCLSKELGTFTYPAGGAMGRGRTSSPGWSNVFASHPGFPLRVSSGTGKVILEVTNVKRGTVAAGEFVVPEGYGDMGNLMGRGRGGGGDR